MSNSVWEKVRRYSHVGQSSDCNFTHAFHLVSTTSPSMDSIILPMLYNMKHYLELVLKANINYLCKFSGAQKMVRKLDHSLTKPSKAFL